MSLIPVIPLLSSPGYYVVADIVGMVGRDLWCYRGRIRLLELLLQSSIPTTFFSENLIHVSI